MFCAMTSHVLGVASVDPSISKMLLCRLRNLTAGTHGVVSQVFDVGTFGSFLKRGKMKRKKHLGDWQTSLKHCRLTHTAQDVEQLGQSAERGAFHVVRFLGPSIFGYEHIVNKKI